MSEPVSIVFLGGLGEIGRNCFCLEVEGRILVVDCGIMFPDADMPGVDLVLPDFTYLRDNADRVEGVFLTHAHEDHAGGLAFLLRDVPVPDLRLAAVARPRPQPHRRSRDARPHRADPGARRRAPPDRPVRLRVHPGHALGAARVRHRVPHARRARSCTPATSSSTSRRSTAAAPTSRCSARSRGASGGVRLLLSDSTNAERPGFTPSESTVGDTHAVAVPRPPRPAVHRRELRVAPAPRAAGRAKRRSTRAAGSRSSAGRWCTTSRSAREMGLLDVPTRPRHRHRGGAPLRAGRGVHHLHRVAGRADERAVAHGRARAQVREGQRGRRRRDLRARDPGQRVQRLAGHRLAAPRRRRGRARRQRGRARVGPRVAGRAEVPPQPRAARVVRARARRVPAPGAPRAPRARGRRRRRTTCSSARTATCCDLRRRRRAERHRGRAPRGARRATCTSTASSATSGTACCATGATSPRRASSS